MKFRRVILMTCLLLITGAFAAGVINRSKATGIQIVSDSELDNFSVNLVFEQKPEQTVPTLTELENKATEILIVEPYERKMSQNLDMLSTVKVRKVIKSGNALQAGDTIWIYESCLFYQRPAGQEFAGALSEPGWISCPYNQLPLRQQTEYLVFLIRPDFPTEYLQSEEEKNTFLYAYPCASAFSAKHSEVYLKPADNAELSPAEKELQELINRPDSAAYQNRIRELQDQIMQEIAARRVTWKDVKAFGFITDNETAKTALETLIAEISNISSETGD